MLLILIIRKYVNLPNIVLSLTPKQCHYQHTYAACLLLHVNALRATKVLILYHINVTVHPNTQVSCKVFQTNVKFLQHQSHRTGFKL